MAISSPRVYLIHECAMTNLSCNSAYKITFRLPVSLTCRRSRRISRRYRPPLMKGKCITHLYTNSRQLSPSLQVISCSGTQEFPRILRSLNIHCSPSLIAILSQINPIHTASFYLSGNHYHIILTSAPRSSY
jgi:hypothetical protein